MNVICSPNLLKYNKYNKIVNPDFMAIIYYDVKPFLPFLRHLHTKTSATITATVLSTTTGTITPAHKVIILNNRNIF